MGKLGIGDGMTDSRKKHFLAYVLRRYGEEMRKTAEVIAGQYEDLTGREVLRIVKELDKGPGIVLVKSECWKTTASGERIRLS